MSKARKKRKCASVFRLPEIHSTDSLKQKKTMLSCFVKLTALREFKALDKEDLDYNAISYDNIGRQVPGIKKANIGSKHDERITFTEEQVRNETARCLGCGATIVDENRCIGCGVCTTRCKFDAIHLVKRFDAPTRSVHNRKKYIENYRKERNDKIAIKKISK